MEVKRKNKKVNMLTRWCPFHRHGGMLAGRSGGRRSTVPTARACPVDYDIIISHCDYQYHAFTINISNDSLIVIWY